MDFTIKKYCKLLDALQKQGFSFQTYAGFIEKPAEKVIILRQDVDRLPENSLRFARIQAERGVKGTYYFRVVKESRNEKIIREIYALGHEIGYHYEDVDKMAQRLRGSKVRWGERERGRKGEEEEKKLVDVAIESFTINLEKMRSIVPVKTICMHGSPLSRWDSRLLWKYYDYHDLGIIGEPYLDIDFDEVLYLTDTGRRWDGGSVSVRDKASGVGRQASGRETQFENPYLKWKVKPINYREKINIETISPSRPLPLSPSSLKFHSTSDIIKAAEENKLPDKVMMTFHPQRWADRPFTWIRELIWQNFKNSGKYIVIRNREES